MSDQHSRSFILKARLLKVVTQSLAMLSGNRLPPFSAVAALVEQDNKLLLVERSDGLGFSLPGGIMRWNESIPANPCLPTQSSFQTVRALCVCIS